MQIGTDQFEALTAAVAGLGKDVADIRAALQAAPPVPAPRRAPSPVGGAPMTYHSYHWVITLRWRSEGEHEIRTQEGVIAVPADATRRAVYGAVYNGALDKLPLDARKIAVLFFDLERDEPAAAPASSPAAGGAS